MQKHQELEYVIPAKAGIQKSRREVKNNYFIIFYWVRDANALEI